jgi:hypothetical protein
MRRQFRADAKGRAREKADDTGLSVTQPPSPLANIFASLLRLKSTQRDPCRVWQSSSLSQNYRLRAVIGTVVFIRRKCYVGRAGVFDCAIFAHVETYIELIILPPNAMYSNLCEGKEKASEILRSERSRNKSLSLRISVVLRVISTRPPK